MRNASTRVAPVFTKLSKRAVLILVALFVYYAADILTTPYDELRTYLRRPASVLLDDALIALVLCTGFCELSLYADRLLNRRLSWSGGAATRLATKAVVHVVISVVFATAMHALFRYLSADVRKLAGSRELFLFLQWLATIISISFSISVLNTGNYMLERWKETALKAAAQDLKIAEMQRASAEAELKALKLQLDPHFFFNNISVLSELILADPQLGHDYAENFSKVYRYLLLYAKRDLVTLEEELKALEAYRFLVEHRMGAGVRFALDVTPVARSRQLPPLVLQLLVENALKHNKTLKESPLVICIRSEGDTALVVSNNLQPISSGVPSAGIGLENIAHRYRLIAGMTPGIEKSAVAFTVTLPLV